MLGKLIKYDLKALAKILAPLWGVLLVMGIIFGISIRSNLEGIGNTMIVFSLVVIVAVIVACEWVKLACQQIGRASCRERV